MSPPKYRNTTFLERLPIADDFWFKGDPYYKDGEGAESFAEFVERTKRVVGKFSSRKGGLVLAFSHQQFITGVQWFLEGRFSSLGRKTMHDFRAYLIAKPVENGGIIEFDL